MKNLSLPDLFRIFRERKKTVLAVMLISAAVLTAAGYFSVPEYNEYRSAQIEEYNTKAIALEERNRKLLEAIEDYRTALSEQKAALDGLMEYKNNAVLMRLDPEKTEHYVLRLDVTYPKKNKKTTVNKVLVKNLKNLAYEKGTETGEGSLNEVIQTEETETGLELILMHDDREKAETVLAAVEESLPSLTEEMSSIYGTMEISSAGMTVRTAEEPKAGAKQKKIISSISSCEKKIQDLEAKIVKTENKQLTAEQKLLPVKSFEPIDLKTFLIRSVPVGFALGFLVSAAWICLLELTAGYRKSCGKAEEQQ